MTAVKDARGTVRRSRRRFGVADIVVLVALVGVTIPLLYLVSVSLMNRAEISSGVLVSAHPAWSNWVEVIATSAIPRSIANSLIAAVGGATLTLAIAVPTAWAISRHRAGGRHFPGILFGCWMLPPIVAVIPLFMLLRTLGLGNSLLGLTLVYALANAPVATWLLDGFLRALPTEIEEAAYVDGAGTLRTLLTVVVPLISPGIIAVGIIAAILNYNEFVLAAFLTQSADTQTLPVAVSLFLGERLTHLGKIAAASVIGIIPVFAGAVLLQRHLVRGLTTGALK